MRSSSNMKDDKIKNANKMPLLKLANIEQQEEVDGGFSVEDFEENPLSLESWFLNGAAKLGEE